MLKIKILGLEEGTHPFSVECESIAIADIFPEFFGLVKVHGTLKKNGKRIFLQAEAECSAHLQCDRSGEEFTEIVKAPISMQYLIDTQLYLLRNEDSSDEGSEILLRDDEQEVDITEDVRQALALNLPMKRISPAYADKPFEEIHPEIVDENKSSEIDLENSPFAALKQLNINKN